MYTTRTTLLEKIAAGDEIGWADFQNTYRGLIYSIAGERGVPEADRDDIVQRTMLGVFNDGVFTYRREKNVKFRSWLGKIIERKIADYFREEAVRHRRISGAKLPEEVSQEDFEAEFLKEYRAHLLSLALEELKSRVEPEIFETFTLCRTGRSDKEVAALLGVKSNTVTIRKRRCAEILNGIIRRLNESDSGLDLPTL